MDCVNIEITDLRIDKDRSIQYSLVYSVFVVTSFLMWAHANENATWHVTSLTCAVITCFRGNFPRSASWFPYKLEVSVVRFLYVRQISLLVDIAMWCILFKVRATDTVHHTFVLIYKSVQILHIELCQLRKGNRDNTFIIIVIIFIIENWQNAVSYIER